MRSFTRRLLFGLPIPFLFSSKEAQADISGERLREGVWHRTELYFGTSRANGTAVTDEQFAQFIDQQVTPRFPDGLTLLSAYGQYRNSAGVIEKEKSFLLILFYPPQMSDARKRIEELRDVYKSTFQQESVLRADSGMSISF